MYMKVPDQLHAKLKSDYFDLISEITLHNGRNIWEGMMVKLKGAIHLKDAAIYMYDPYLQTYCLKSRLGNEPANLQESITEKEIYNLTRSEERRVGKECSYK